MTLPESALRTRPTPLALSVWRTIVWDDAVNLMDYVTHVFQRHFGYTHDHAENLMLEVHLRGRAVVSEGTRERMEADVVAMHSYGLRATLESVPEDAGA